MLAVIALCWSAVAGAQQPVYLCNGTYTDQPCKGGKEVDILPSRGAHSMSGTRKESGEAVRERVMRDIDSAYQKGIQQGRNSMRCDQLLRRRQALEKSSSVQDLDGERLRIREEQFALKCRRN
ncbi:MAG: hypothetical protein DI587_08815 [Variovorax paradoxus]|nr:MAG: hypothetical protein DI583_08815 [Variovorax paradoxus]PZQ12772.1 MAG: hypothetical protein DI587_08815 [Variovorax paradoxus]